MAQIRLRPMSDAEFETYRARLIPEYAVAHVEAGDWDPDQAEALAAREVDLLVPSGPRTAGMLMLMAEDGDGEQIGLVWIALNRSRPGSAWIYDIQISPEHQGKGYGRALLQAAEEQAREHGSTDIALHVFGANTVARNLYESAGYEATSVLMRKSLDGGPAGAREET
jgi:ribosomal protein S18 acetylase RimI-like enzyme